MNVSKIKSFFLNNKKSLFYAGFFIFSFFLFNELAFAGNATGPAWATWTNNDSNFINDGIKAVNFLLIISWALLWATTSLVSLFLTPSWVNGTIFGLDWYMKDIWIMVSNLVYFIFAFILIMIAFMNIIGKWDKWELKSALPKFIVWVIMVPFTWFFVQFVLSLSAILTIGVLTLPYDSFWWTQKYQEAQQSFGQMINKIKWDTNSEWEAKDEIPTTFVLNLTETITEWDTLKKKKEFFDQWNRKTIESILSWKEEPDSIFWIISLYTYGVMQVQESDITSSDDIANSIRSISDLTLKVIFDALFILIYMILMIALFLALLVRGIKLWVYAMLSPAFGLLYFFDKTDGVWSGSWKFWIKDFISLALVPVYVAAALSFWLLFIMVANHGMWTSSLLTSCDNSKYTDSFTAEMVSTSTDKSKMTCLGVGSFTFAIQWAHSGAPTWNALWKIIMQLFGIVILWISVMMALKQSEITEQIAKPIWDFWNSVWGLVAKSPMYAPIIPTGTWLMSASWLQRVWAQAKTSYEEASRNTWNQFMQDYGLFGQQKIDLSTKSINALKAYETEWMTNTVVWKVKESITAWGTVEVLSKDNNFRELIVWLSKNPDLEGTMDMSLFDKNLDNPTNLARAMAELDHAMDRKYWNQRSILSWTRRWSEARPQDINQSISWKTSPVASEVGQDSPTPSMTPTTITINNSPVNLPNQIVRGADDSINHAATAEKIRGAMPKWTTINDDIIAQIRSWMTPIEWVTPEDVNNIIDVLKP